MGTSYCTFCRRVLGGDRAFHVLPEAVLARETVEPRLERRIGEAAVVTRV
jgi:hypothetical protein